MSVHVLASVQPSGDESPGDGPVSPGARQRKRLGAAQRQHQYQKALYAAMVTTGPLGTSEVLALGWHRIELGIPARIRLWRWQARRVLREIRDDPDTTFVASLRAFRGSRRILKQILPLLVVLGASVACSLVSGDGPSGPGSGFALGPFAPELSKPDVANKNRPSRLAPWAYVLPFDHGVRADRSGEGYFRAPRFHGEHNGVDLLAPIGTSVYSPCAGQAMSGVSKSFGRWLHVICPVPDEFAPKGGPHPWASFFFAHLDGSQIPKNKWSPVAREQVVGAVGKSGNASGESIQPHVHLEFIVQRNRRSAMDEGHLGSDQSEVPAAEHFADVLAQDCMIPHGFEPKSHLIRRARRIDPFVVLTCLSEMKPNYQKAPSPLTEHSHAWTQFYVAKSFNVNLGVEDSSIAKR